ncbi:MAG: DUF1788 domain-containing protein [Acidimicrobiia bacterium]|nr:DUF1788 domain-containing protein [Acidimicrobiia bacterium]
MDGRHRSLAEVMWHVIDASGRWETWLELEPEARPTRSWARCGTPCAPGGVGPAGPGAHHPRSGRRPEPNRLLFLTDALLLHPFFRVRTIESLVHDRVGCATVLFYPGTRVGQYGLRFLGFYSEDPNYRSSIIGGDP